MPKHQLEEWEKSQRLNSDLRRDIRNAAVLFCFKPLHDIFIELLEVLVWDFYHHTVDKELFALYNEKPELILRLVKLSNKLDFNMHSLPYFTEDQYRQHSHHPIYMPLEVPLFKNADTHTEYHRIRNIEEPKNKKELALKKRFEQLNTDISLFNKRVNKFNSDMEIALQSAVTTGSFIRDNPEFEGYMKQSLKKFYNSKHPDVIESLNSAMNVRTYASITSGHRLQAYQASMLAQLQQLEPRHTPIQALPQT